ncbi:hypothetical protein LUZ62_024375 [Rhynchospora pubera]|uniref:Late embryogenesis abundant protein LEA-2 subgroup domain-containing protein n=1 Tax=Rhynchospora pubera TaxID=906938 RepID=A0AAV8CTM4_9POAL|nr:hypothetical protein LUZ62_069718 [Rhynchospora pubera]KAJ4811809.1 hypothetical protein LUZ62_024375 [Rhynchospora pubera]
MAGPYSVPGLPGPRPSKLQCIAIALLFLIIIVGLIILIFWLIVRPTSIDYTVEHAAIQNFNISSANELDAAFNLTLRAINPNRRVSVYYDDVKISIWYDNQMIALTEASPFFQPHRNITRLDIKAVTNSTQLQDQVAKDLQHDKSSGHIGLEVRVRARIRFKVGVVKSKHYKLRAYCTPVKVGFAPNSATSFDRVYCDVEI